MDQDYFIRVIIEGRDNLSRSLATASAKIKAFKSDVDGLDQSLNKLRGTSEKASSGFAAFTQARGAARNDSERAARSEANFGRVIEDTTNKFRASRAEWQKFERAGTAVERTLFRAGSAARGAARSMFDLQRGVRDMSFAARRAEGVFFNFAYNVTRNANNFIESFTRMNTIAALLAPILFTAVVALSNLAAALVAVGSAATVAAAALGGAFLSGLLQVVPVVGLLVAAFSRLSLIMKANKLEGKEAGAGHKAAADGAKQHREAAQRLADAQYNLKQQYQTVADAARDVRDAEKKLQEERAQAAKDLVDTQFAKTDAILAERDANLALLEARKNLRDQEQQDVQKQRLAAELRQSVAQAKEELSIAQASGDQAGIQSALAKLGSKQSQLTGATTDAQGSTSELDRRRAELEVAQAVQRKKESEVTTARAIAAANLAEKQGIEQAPRVVEAKRRIVETNRALARAEHELARAQREVADAAKDLTTAVTSAATAGGGKSALEQITDRLTPTEQKLQKTIQAFKKLWEQATLPLTDAILGAIDKAIKLAGKLLQDKKFLGVFKTLADTIGEQIVRLAEFFASPEQRKFFEQFTTLANQNLPAVVTIFTQIVGLVERIGVAFAPIVRNLLQGASKFLGRQIKSADRGGKEGEATALGGFAQQSQVFLDSFLSFLASFFRLIGAIISVSKGAGKGALDDMADSFNKWAEALRTTKKEAAQDFFENAIRVSGKLLNLFAKILAVFFKVSQNKSFEHFIDLLGTVGIEALENVAKVYSTMFSALARLTDGPGAGKLLELFLTFFALSKLTPIGAIGSAIIKSGIILALNANTAALWANTGGKTGGLFGKIPVVGKYLGGGAETGGAAAAGRVAAGSVPFGAPLAGAAGGTGAIAGLAAAAPGILVVTAAVLALGAAIYTVQQNFLGLRTIMSKFFNETIVKPIKDLGSDLKKLLDALTGGNAEKVIEGTGKSFQFLARHAGRVLDIAAKIVGTAVIVNMALMFGRLFIAIKLVITIIDKFVEVITAIVRRAPGWGRAIASGIVGGFRRIRNLIEDIITGLPARMLKTVAGIAGGLADVGVAIVKAVVNGIKNAPESVVDAILEKVPKPLRKGVEGVLGIAGKGVDVVTGNRRLGGPIDGSGPYSRVPASAFAGADQYATGGAVRGMGAAVPIMAHVGEWVLNNEQQRRLASALGKPVGLIKDFLFGPKVSGREVSEGKLNAASQRKERARKMLAGVGNVRHGITDMGYQWFGFGPDIDNWAGTEADAGAASPVFMDTPLGQFVEIGKSAGGALSGGIKKMIESKGFWVPEIAKRAQGFATATKAQVNDWKRSHVMRGLGLQGDPSIRNAVVENVLRSPLWSYGTGGEVGWSPSTVSMPAFAQGGEVTTPAVEGGGTATTRTVNQKFDIHSRAPDIDVSYIMRVAKHQAEAGF